MDASVKLKSSAALQATKESSSVNVLSEMHALQLKLEAMESSLCTHQHIPVGQEAPAQCTSRITGTQVKATHTHKPKHRYTVLNRALKNNFNNIHTCFVNMMFIGSDEGCGVTEKRVPETKRTSA